MGFFSLKANCAICGKEVGLNRFMIGRTTSGKEIWKCPACTKLGGFIKIDYVTGKAVIIQNEDTEKRMKCNVCGHFYCYTYEDILRSAVRSTCPNCNSTDIREVQTDEWERRFEASVQTPAQTSPADELKKYKELLDCGVITQEEFNAKKKQLLGL